MTRRFWVYTQHPAACLCVVSLRYNGASAVTFILKQRIIRMITLVKDWTPPVLWRLAKKLAYGYLKNRDGQGAERGAEFYDQSFRAHDHWRRHYTESPYYPLWIVVADRLKRTGAASIIDIGCGSGQVACLLRDNGIPGYLGIDFSHERIQWATSICPEYRFTEADIFQTDLLQTHSYDTALCIEFLEHVERDLEVIETIRPGTHFYGSVPNFPSSGHVRHFLDPQAVTERYSPYFASFTVDAIRQDAEGRHVRFLMQGVKQ